jgi:hypothetical protein
MDFKQIATVEEINSLIESAKERKLEILDKCWEDLYKKRCPKHFLSFSKILKEIEYKNWLDEENLKNFTHFFRIEKINESDTDISTVMSIAHKYKLAIPESVSAMVCEACACNGCPYIKEHLGYTCEECRKRLSYTGYEGYCDE